MIDVILVEFGIQLPMNVLTDYPTVERLATLLRGHAGRLSGPLVAIQDGDGTRPPLFLVHPDDGQVVPYCRLAYALGEEFAVFGLQAAGLYSDDEPRRTVPAMADCLRRRDPGGARQAAPICSAAAGSARRSPTRWPSASTTCGCWPRSTLNCLNRRAPAPSPGCRSRPGHLDLPRILASWQERDLVPQNVPPEFVARSLRVWQANRDALRDWRPSPYAGPVDVFGLPPVTALPTTVVQRTHECGADGRLTGALRELIG